LVNIASMLLTSTGSQMNANTVGKQKNTKPFCPYLIHTQNIQFHIHYLSDICHDIK
jgi:hypothetical protein